MRTNLTTRGLSLFLLIVSLLSLRAEPTNIMIEDLTFTRPENWTWAEPTDRSPALSRFLIPDTHGLDVRFYVIKKDYTSERASLHSQFPESKLNDLKEQEVKVGKRRIIYFEISGTYVYKDSSPKPDLMFVGAAIPAGKQYTYARMLGRRSDVEASMATFKKMVEGAVQDREENAIIQ